MNNEVGTTSQAVLGSFLLDPSEILNHIDLETESFPNSQDRILWETIKGMTKASKPVDLLTVGKEMGNAGLFDQAGGPSYLANLTSLVPSTANLEHYVSLLKEELNKAKTVQAIKESLEAIASDKDVEKVKRDLSSKLRDLTQTKGTTFKEFLKNKILTDQERDPEKLLGPALNRFHDLSKDLDGIQPGLYIIGAEPNIGKSTFSTSLIVDYLQANPEAGALYISLDDPRGTVSSSMLTNLTFQSWEKVTAEEQRSRNSMVQVNALKKRITDQRTKKAFSIASGTLLNWAESGRLDIRDIEDANTAGKVENIIRATCERFPNVLVVIDALFNLDIEDQTAGGIREANIARANLLKQLADVYKVPIFTTAEIRKADSKTGPRDMRNPPRMGDIMESGKFAYNANVVFMLYPFNHEAFTDNGNNSPSLVIEVVKNKLSSWKGQRYFDFYKSSQYLSPTDSPKDPKPTNDTRKAGEPEAKPKAGANGGGDGTKKENSGFITPISARK